MPTLIGDLPPLRSPRLVAVFQTFADHSLQVHRTRGFIAYVAATDEQIPTAAIRNARQLDRVSLDVLSRERFEYLPVHRTTDRTWVRWVAPFRLRVSPPPAGSWQSMATTP